VKLKIICLELNLVSLHFDGLFKGILHPKMQILSPFTYPQVVATLYDILSSAEHKGRYFEERLELWHH